MATAYLHTGCSSHTLPCLHSARCADISMYPKHSDSQSRRPRPAPRGPDTAQDQAEPLGTHRCVWPGRTTPAGPATAAPQDPGHWQRDVQCFASLDSFILLQQACGMQIITRPTSQGKKLGEFRSFPDFKSLGSWRQSHNGDAATPLRDGRSWTCAVPGPVERRRRHNLWL